METSSSPDQSDRTRCSRATRTCRQAGRQRRRPSGVEVGAGSGVAVDGRFSRLSPVHSHPRAVLKHAHPPAVAWRVWNRTVTLRPGLPTAGAWFEVPRKEPRQTQMFMRLPPDISPSRPDPAQSNHHLTRRRFLGGALAAAAAASINEQRAGRPACAKARSAWPSCSPRRNGSKST